MSKVKIEGNASGTGTLTIAAPNTNTDRTLTLPDGAGEILTDAAIGTSVLAPDGDGSSLTGISAGWNVVSSGTASAAASIEISLPTTYNTYAIYLKQLVPSVDAGLYCLVSTDNGSTYKTGASDYSFTNSDIAYGPLNHNSYTMPSNSSLSGSSLDGFVYIHGSQNTSTRCMIQPVMVYGLAAWAPVSGPVEQVRGCRANTTSVINKIKLYYNNSATLTGSYVLYGLSES